MCVHKASWKVGLMGEGKGGELPPWCWTRKKQDCLLLCIPAEPEFLGEGSGTRSLGRAPGTPVTLMWSSLAAQKNGKIR